MGISDDVRDDVIGCVIGRVMLRKMQTQVNLSPHYLPTPVSRDHSNSIAIGCLFLC